MIEGLTGKHLSYFCDMLIMANDYQLESMGNEIVHELRKRRNRHVLEELPRFPEV